MRTKLILKKFNRETEILDQIEEYININKCLPLFIEINNPDNFFHFCKCFGHNPSNHYICGLEVKYRDEQ